MNKPLDAKDFTAIAEILGNGTDDRCSLNQVWSQKVLASERYWREEAHRKAAALVAILNEDPMDSDHRRIAQKALPWNVDWKAGDE